MSESTGELQTAASPEAATAAGEGVAVHVKDFDGYYGDFQALKSVSLDMPERRVTALIGPSGCGKSTFLRWLNRMNDRIDTARASGTVLVSGDDIFAPSTDVVALRRRVGMVFQRPNPFPKSIRDNVLYGPKLHYRIGRSQAGEILEASLRAAALWDEVKDRLNDSALGLSGGQQQRLCIARAIALAPEVLLMDEPCSALDPQSTKRIEELIAQLRERYTIVIVTHNMQQAQRVSDRTAFFYEGEVVESGNTNAIFDEPREQRTSDYVHGRFG